jgi:hypothetical protein
MKFDYKNVNYPKGIEWLSLIGISRSAIKLKSLCSLCLCGEKDPLPNDHTLYRMAFSRREWFWQDKSASRRHPTR